MGFCVVVSDPSPPVMCQTLAGCSRWKWTVRCDAAALHHRFTLQKETEMNSFLGCRELLINRYRQRYLLKELGFFSEQLKQDTVEDDKHKQTSVRQQRHLAADRLEPILKACV